MKNVNFIPKDVQRILPSHKISEKYNEQEVFYKNNLFLRIWQHSQENTYVKVSFLIKIQAFMPATLLKRDSNTDVLLTILHNF